MTENMEDFHQEEQEMLKQTDERGESAFSFRSLLAMLFFLFFHIFAQMVGIGLYLSIFRGIQLSEGTDAVLAALQDTDVLAAGTLIMAFFVVPTYYFYLKARERRHPGTFFTEIPSSDTCLRMFFLIFSSQGLVYAFTQAIALLSEKSRFFQEAMREYEDIIQSVGSDESRISLLIAGVVVAGPIMEELLFRGIVQGELQRVMKARYAIFLSALIFGIFHGNFIQSAYAFMVGLVLGYAYWKSRSMILSISLHIVFNFLGGALPIMLGENSAAMQTISLIQMLAGVFLLFFLVYRALTASTHSSPQ